jgi:hypothetical protein
MLWFAMFASLCKCMYTFYFTWRMKRLTEFASGIYHAPRLGKSLKLRLIHGNRKKISIISIVVYSVPFGPERTENLVPVCKPVQDTPHSISGKISGCFGQ